MIDRKNHARMPFLCGNWKMNKGVTESVALAQHLVQALRHLPHDSIEVAIAPSFVSLFPVAHILKNQPLKLAGQNCFWENKGSYTGEISAAELFEIGCHYVILGHSERRRFCGETDLQIQKKIVAALSAGLQPIFCVGEKSNVPTSESIFSSLIQSELEEQLSIGLAACSTEMLTQIVIAYEPTWAIGTGVAASPDWAQQVHRFIRNFVKKRFGAVADMLRIVYGGSVTSAHVANFLAKPDIDGALVGGASLVAETFLEIVRYHEEIGCSSRS